jgi:hypothetical protein
MDRSSDAAMLVREHAEACFAIAEHVAKLSRALSQRIVHASYGWYGAALRLACSPSQRQRLMAVLLRMLLLLPSQARFDLPCSRWRLLEAGSLASGVAKVAPAVAARRHLQAAEGSEMGATAVRYFR